MTLIEKLGELSFVEVRDGRLYSEMGEDVTDELLSLLAEQPAQHIEHCLWARNGNRPCPHVQPTQVDPCIDGSCTCCWSQHDEQTARQPMEIAGRKVMIDWKAEALELRKLVRLGGIKIAELEALAEQPAQLSIPKTPEQISDFIGSDYLWREPKVSDVVPHEDDKYCVSAHDMISAFARLAEQPTQQQEPVAWRELCRRLYFELYWCDRQMMETLDENGEPMWTQGKTVRDVLADAKAALETSPPASKPLTDEEIKRRKPISADFVSFRAGVRCMEREYGSGAKR